MAIQNFFNRGRGLPVHNKDSSSKQFETQNLISRSSSPGGKNETSSGTRALRYRFQGFVLWLNILLFCCSAVVYLSIASLKTEGRARERNWLLKQTSEPSPLLELMDIPLVTKRLNGTFVELEPASIFRQDPSPEVDAAWARVESQNPIPISRKDVIAQGRDPDEAAKFPASFGFGPDAYIGRIDVLHQIHCLNLLRKHIHWNFDHYYSGERMNRYHKLHVSHCLYILLQNLQCAGNVDVYSHYWADAQENAYPDFNINHKCRDFDAILDWYDAHAVPLEKFGAIRRPEGMKPRIMNHAFKEAFEWYDADHPDDGDLGQAVG